MNEPVALKLIPERVVLTIADHRLVEGQYKSTPGGATGSYVACRCGMRFVRVEQWDQHLAKLIFEEGQGR